MSYGQGTGEFRMGEQGIYPGPGVGPGLKPDGSGSRLRAPMLNFDDWEIGQVYTWLLVGLLLWPLVLAVVLTFLLVGLVVALVYLVQQVPDERYEAAGRWIIVHLQRALGWCRRLVQSLVLKISAVHPGLAKWRRHFLAQRRGRPLPAAERIHRR